MMIRALLRKQLRELGAAFLRSSKTGKARSRASAMGYALLFAVLVVVLMLCFAAWPCRWLRCCSGRAGLAVFCLYGAHGAGW